MEAQLSPSSFLVVENTRSGRSKLIVIGIRGIQSSICCAPRETRAAGGGEEGKGGGRSARVDAKKRALEVGEEREPYLEVKGGMHRGLFTEAAVDGGGRVRS